MMSWFYIFQVHRTKQETRLFKIRKRFLLMKLTNIITRLSFLAMMSCQQRTTINASQSTDYAIRGISFNKVHFNDRFWEPKIDTNQTVTIPAWFAKCKEMGRLNLLNGVEFISSNQMKAIPYVAWNNRGANKMKRWLPSDEIAHCPLKKPNIRKNKYDNLQFKI